MDINVAGEHNMHRTAGACTRVFLLRVRHGGRGGDVAIGAGPYWEVAGCSLLAAHGAATDRACTLHRMCIRVPGN